MGCVCGWCGGVCNVWCCCVVLCVFVVGCVVVCGVCGV